MQTYLALGDSYTIGEGTLSEENFPHLLIQAINTKKGIPCYKQPTIIATTGWTTDELIKAIATSITADKYDMVSLLIGVNNQYRNYPIAQYEAEFIQLLQTAINKCKSGAKRVFVVSIPDWGNTRFGQQHESHTPENISIAIDEYNEIAAKACQHYAIPFIDITTSTRHPAVKDNLLVADGLHYNKTAHANWVAKIMQSIPAYFKD